MPAGLQHQRFGEGYFGLKMAGFTADHPALARARKKILEMAA